MLGSIVKAAWPKGPFLTAAVLALLGVVLLVGGVWLLVLGGSWYYALTGAELIVCGVLLWRGSVWGLRLYWLALAITFVWALVEVGPEPWLLMPRVLAPMFIGAWLCMPWVRRKISIPASPRWLPSPWIWPLLGGVGIAVLLATMLQPPIVTAPTPLSPSIAQGAADWPEVGNSHAASRFSNATQINTKNVAGLQEAWRFRSGVTLSTLEATPILAAGHLVFCTADNVVMALDPDTGKEMWRYVPAADTEQRMHLACRGVVQATVDTVDGICANRLYVATIDARLIALDAATGAVCQAFGNGGVVSLMDGIGEQPRGFYYTTSPPLVALGVVVVGAYVMDNQRVNAPSGVVRAFDATTGALRWAWDMGRPERTAPPSGEIYTPGTPNVWSMMSADLKLGLVYLPLGNPAPDFWGGKRREFDDRYGSSIVALDLRTGEPAWSFQTTHHDVWDYDVPAAPVLVDLPGAESARPALVAPTKRGELFVLDRRTGEPIFPVTERPAPQGAAAGDRLSPTQPYSAVSLAPPPLTERDMWGLTPVDQLLCRITFRRVRYAGNFTPPGVTPSLKYPGAFGIIDWGGVAIDEDNGTLIANTSYVASIDHLVPREQAPEFARQVSDARDYEWGPQEDAPFVIRTRFFLSRLKVPCTAPPWGRINAIDLHTGQLRWSRPLGTAQDSGPLDIRSRLPLEVGVPNTGGAVVTRGGLAFVGASVDHYLRAFDTATGAELWRGRLPAAGHATPMTFISPRSGRQFVVIAAGGHASMAPVLNDSIVAYALPAVEK